MAVAAVHVPVLQLRGGGQDVVGVVGGVGLEMLQHHGEQVFAGKALHHFARIRGHGDGVAVVDHQRLDRCRGVQQGIADGAHVDGAGPAPGQQIGPLQGCALYRELA